MKPNQAFENKIHWWDAISSGKALHSMAQHSKAQHRTTVHAATGQKNSKASLVHHMLTCSFCLHLISPWQQQQGGRAASYQDKARPAYLEDLLHLTFAAEALPPRDHQERCHLGIGSVSHCQCLVPSWAQP